MSHGIDRRFQSTMTWTSPFLRFSCSTTVFRFILPPSLSSHSLARILPHRAPSGRIGIVVFSQGCTLGYLILPLWGIKTKIRASDPRTNRKDLQRLVGLFVRRDIGVFHAGGMAACSRWLSAATPPENGCNLLHPSGMPACFIFRCPSFSLAPLPGCILYFVVPVVSLRSTTGYML